MGAEKEEIEIDLKEIFSYLYSHLYVLILSGLIGAMLMYLISALILPKQYLSSTKIYVLNQQEQQTVTYNDLQTGTQLTKDYAKLVVSRAVTTQVMADLDLQNQYEDMAEITPDDLAEMITVENLSDTRVIQITVKDVSPIRAQDIANAVRVAASKHIYEVMDIEAVNVVDTASLPEKPDSPSKLKNAVIGGVAGLLLAIGIYVVVYLLDDTIKTPDDVERFLGLSVLASIPYDEAADTVVLRKKMKKKRKKSKAVLDASSGSEAVRATLEAMEVKRNASESEDK